MGIKISNHFVVLLRGGLGNQLFQLYAGQNYADKYFGSFSICTKFLSQKSNRLDPTYRGFQLNDFDSFSDYKFDEKRFAVLKSRFAQIYPQLDLKLGILRSLNQHVNKKTSILDGYFQESDYIWANRLRIENELGIGPKFLLSSDLKSLNIDFLNSAVIHLRLGDYLQLRDFSVLDEAALLKILSLRELENKKLYVVTDSEDLASAHYSKIFSQRNVEIIESGSFSAKRIIDLISRFEIVVLSKSSLSWWGGFLAILNNKSVFAPFSERSKVGNFNRKQLIPGWIEFQN